MTSDVRWESFGDHPPAPPTGEAAAAVVPTRDGFADPHGLVVRADALATVGGLADVRAGALADLVARLQGAGHGVVAVPADVPARRATPAALLRDGAARLWLFRRHPKRHPLPRPGGVRDLPRFALLALGALRANGAPTRR